MDSLEKYELEQKRRGIKILLSESQYQFLKQFYKTYNWQLEDKIDEFCQRVIDKELKKAMDIAREIKEGGVIK